MRLHRRQLLVLFVELELAPVQHRRKKVAIFPVFFVAFFLLRKSIKIELKEQMKKKCSLYPLDHAVNNNDIKQWCVSDEMLTDKMVLLAKYMLQIKIFRVRITATERCYLDYILETRCGSAKFATKFNLFCHYIIIYLILWKLCRQTLARTECVNFLS